MVAGMKDLTVWKGSLASWLNQATQDEIYNALARGLIDLSPLRTDPFTVYAHHMGWHGTEESTKIAERRRHKPSAARDPNTGQWYAFEWKGLLNRHSIYDSDERLPWDQTVTNGHQEEMFFPRHSPRKKVSA
jgi:hypothetical protein